jgi:hypothetical protein
MVTTARTAMRSGILPQAPKLGPMLWVLQNKLKVSLGRPIRFDDYVDYTDVKPTPRVERINFLENRHKVALVTGRDTVDSRYPLKSFENT